MKEIWHTHQHLRQSGLRSFRSFSEFWSSQSFSHCYGAVWQYTYNSTRFRYCVFLCMMSSFPAWICYKVGYEKSIRSRKIDGQDNAFTDEEESKRLPTEYLTDFSDLFIRSEESKQAKVAVVWLRVSMTEYTEFLDNISAIRDWVCMQLR